MERLRGGWTPRAALAVFAGLPLVLGVLGLFWLRKLAFGIPINGYWLNPKEELLNRLHGRPSPQANIKPSDSGVRLSDTHHRYVVKSGCDA